ncbi:hypothetical protein B0H16DRAFT_1838042 [Mycena metata]|uniref:Uncharacterized protein n=1 Tax=Mycena metata TaxID=1033252 RepID=A0AAD7K8D3_9AGAR|nr:hypothetical protein B0H16DRAFT_1838042 [Mycena metata]
MRTAAPAIPARRPKLRIGAYGEETIDSDEEDDYDLDGEWDFSVGRWRKERGWWSCTSSDHARSVLYQYAKAPAYALHHLLDAGPLCELDDAVHLRRAQEPVFCAEGLLRIVLDNNKRVQEAGCSAFAALEEDVGIGLALYIASKLILLQAKTRQPASDENPSRSVTPCLPSLPHFSVVIPEDEPAESVPIPSDLLGAAKTPSSAAPNHGGSDTDDPEPEKEPEPTGIVQAYLLQTMLEIKDVQLPKHAQPDCYRVGKTFWITPPDRYFALQEYKSTSGKKPQATAATAGYVVLQ